MDKSLLASALKLPAMRGLVLSIALAPVVLGLACAHRGETREAPDRPAPLSTSELSLVQPGMTLSDVLRILGPHAEINPLPSPVAHFDHEVVVLWRDGPGRWILVIFVPDKDRVLRVPEGTTYAGSMGL